jgi:CBS domain-containing membrane protein
MMDISTQHVYARGRDYYQPVPVSSEPRRDKPRVPTISDGVPIRQIMTSELVCVREDLDVGTAIELVTRCRVGCLPVVDDAGFPIGIVTKHDLLEAAQGGAFELRHIMMPMAFTLADHASVAHAAAMMNVEGVHHVPIVAGDGRLVGVVSSFDIVRWLVTNDGLYGA